MKNIIYKVGITPATSEIIDVYDSSGIIRPTNDSARIEKMYANSNLIVTAWLGAELIGISRSLADFCFACYLSDLAVKIEYQKHGIGKELIILTRREIGNETALILLAAAAAMEYYPKIGFDKIENGFIIRRQ